MEEAENKSKEDSKSEEASKGGVQKEESKDPSDKYQDMLNALTESEEADKAAEEAVKNAEEAAKKAQEAKEEADAAKEAADKAKEKAEKERIAKERADKKAAEKAAKKKAAEEAKKKKEEERAEKKRLAAIEADKKAKEKAEKKRLAAIEAEKKKVERQKRWTARKEKWAAIWNKAKQPIIKFLSGFSARRFAEVLMPNKSSSRQVMVIVVALWIVAAGWYWTNNTSEILPRPGEIWTAFQNLVNEGGLIGEMWVSMKLCIDAMLKTILISLIICYATVMPVFKPVAFIVTKFRFLSLVGLSFIFTLMTDDGYNLKIALLSFCMTVFFVTSMLRVMKDITSNEFAHARTLGMSEWRVVWEVVVLSRIDKVFDIIRQNFAIAWLMITIVEGLSRADGGVGAMLINQNKHLHLDAVFAIQFLILFVGIGMDYLIGAFKRLCCPYAHLTKESKS